MTRTITFVQSMAGEMASLTDYFNHVSTEYYVIAVQSHPQSVGSRQSSNLWGNPHAIVGMITSHHAQQLPPVYSALPLTVFTRALARQYYFVLIHVLGTARIEAPLGHCVTFFHSNNKHLSVLELFFKGCLY